MEHGHEPRLIEIDCFRVLRWVRLARTGAAAKRTQHEGYAEGGAYVCQSNRVSCAAGGTNRQRDRKAVDG